MNDYSANHLTVAVTCQRDNKYLLVKEKIQQAIVYNQPAGHVEYGEKITTAAIRETLEETGYHIELLSFLGVSIYHAPNNICYYRMSFHGQCIGEPQSSQLDEGIIAAEWLTYDEICKLTNLRGPLVLRDIEKLRAGKEYPLEIIDENP